MKSATDSYGTALAAVRAAQVALDDWINTYAPEMCDAKRVAEAEKRIGEWGTLAYIANVQRDLREAIEVLNGSHGPKEPQDMPRPNFILSQDQVMEAVRLGIEADRAQRSAKCLGCGEAMVASWRCYECHGPDTV